VIASARTIALVGRAVLTVIGAGGAGGFEGIYRTGAGRAVALFFNIAVAGVGAAHRAG
jgi:hypothetical protein